MMDFPITARMEACLRAGDMDRLHLALAGWTAEELNLLREDLRASYRAGVDSLDKQLRMSLSAASPEYRQANYEAYRAERIALAELFAEILTVVRSRLDALNHNVEAVQ